MSITITATGSDGGSVDLTVQSGIGPVGPQGVLVGGTGIVTSFANGNSTVTLNATLSDLTDVSAVAPSAGQVLEWDGTQWAPGTDTTLSLASATPSNLGTAAAGTGTAAARDDHVHAMPGLGDLTDVTLGSPATGEVLTYNGTAWVAAADSTDLTGYATEAFVTAAVSNLVDSSPAALDTLNELAAALGDDPNFSTTITNSLAGKANLSHTHEIADVTGLQSALDDKAATANLATVATSGSYSDLSNTPTLGTAAATNSTDYATAAQGSLADSAVQPGDLATVATSGNYTDLAGIPSEFTPAAHNHVKANITDLTTGDLDLEGNRCLFANVYSTLADLPSAATYHGMVAHVHAEGAAYYAHAGAWVKLADAADVPSNLADLADVSGSPSADQALIYTGTEWQPGDIPAGTTLNGLSGDLTLTNGTGITLTESGSTLTLSAAIPPSNIGDLADVSADSPSVDQILVFNGTAWEAQNNSGGTTVNTLAGAVTLVAGDNISISEAGQNITIASTASALQGADGADGDPANITLGDITTLSAGSNATATLTGTAPDYTLSFGIPAGATGATGPQGDAGPTTNLTIGTVTTGAAGSNASATISGTAPDLTLNLTLPKGAVGATGAAGPQGDPGPTTNLTIGTVTTGTAGSNATASVTGTPPNLTLDLTIPRGDTGANGTSGMSLGLFFALS